ncbi:amidohydrolase family protein [Novosphingobium colocasiae]|uniref:N-acyl-D-amino-acid deacylase family protein n=1 Tax=Novosphingobium colocasiae TaxID=1256513 RepID=UPI0035B4D34B
MNNDLHDAPFDLIFDRATVIDGTGAPSYVADVAVSGDRIALIGDLSDRAAVRRVDAEGLILSPGFIDVHTHQDNALLVGPEMAPSVSQGITTIVTGNCGISLAPLVRDTVPAPLDLLVSGTPGPFIFSTFAAYLDAVRSASPAINAAPLVGHSTLRVAVMEDVTQPATDAEIEAMKALLDECMRAGAIGMSSGLFYPPARVSKADEVVALLEVVSAYGGVYTTHMRDEADAIMDSLEESFTTARSADVPLIISHHKCMGQRNFGRSIDTLARIDAAAEEQSVALDAYPYVAGSSSLLHDLAAKSSSTQITWSMPYPDLAGRNVADIAAEWGISEDAAIDRLKPGGAIYHMMSQEDLDRIISHPKCMIGSDGLPHDKMPHPRLWGTFPRVLGHFCRERGLFPLKDIIRRMTQLPAQEYGLVDRGTLRVGAFADLVLFDADRVGDRATYDDPAAPADGIEMVVVNGQPVGDARRSGRVLTRQR